MSIKFLARFGSAPPSDSHQIAGDLPTPYSHCRLGSHAPSKHIRPRLAHVHMLIPQHSPAALVPLVGEVTVVPVGVRVRLELARCDARSEDAAGHVVQARERDVVVFDGGE